jgi:hypothetical protein
MASSIMRVHLLNSDEDETEQRIRQNLSGPELQNSGGRLLEFRNSGLWNSGSAREFYRTFGISVPSPRIVASVTVR